jgi:O-antigen/teichoic acid export membrane protein
MEKSDKQSDVCHPDNGVNPLRTLKRQKIRLDDLSGKAHEGVRWNLVGRLSVSGINLFTTVVLARFLGPKEFGLFSLGIVAVGFLQEFADGGMSNAIIRDPDLRGPALALTFWANAMIGILLSGVAFGLLPMVPLINKTEGISLLIKWLSVSLVISSVGNYFSWIARRDMNFRVIAIIDIVAAMTWLTVSTMSAILGYGVLSLAIGFLARTGLRSLLFPVVLKARIPTLSEARSATRNLKEHAFLFRFSFFQILERTVYFLGNNVDFIIIAFLLGPTALGYYTIAYNLMVSIVRGINPLIMSVAFPAISRVKSDKAMLRKSYLKIIRYLSVMVLPILVGGALVGRPLIEVAYGRPWALSTDVFQTLCVFGIFYSLRAATCSLLQVIGRADLSFLYNLVALVLFAVSDWIGAVYWGISGVASLLVISSLLILTPIDFYLRNRFLGTDLNGFSDAIQPAAIATVLMGIVVFATQLLLTKNVGSLVSLLILVILGGTVYGVFLRVFSGDTVNEIMVALLGKRAQGKGV